MTITYLEILIILRDNPNFERLVQFHRIFRGDDNFFVASSEWYEKEFFDFFKTILKNFNCWDYETSWDCDKYANMFQALGNICHAQNEPKKSNAIAIAEIHYLPNMSITRHAINCVICDDKKLRFVEPQQLKFIELSDSEQRSITFMKW